VTRLILTANLKRNQAKELHGVCFHPVVKSVEKAKELCVICFHLVVKSVKKATEFVCSMFSSCGQKFGDVEFICENHKLKKMCVVCFHSALKSVEKAKELFSICFHSVVKSFVGGLLLTTLNSIVKITSKKIVCTCSMFLSCDEKFCLCFVVNDIES
jgi:hypothetical protein